MNWFRRLIRRNEMERRLDSELSDHLARLEDQFLRSGKSRAEARRLAQSEFGRMDAVKEDCRDARGTYLVESSIQDLRLALRTLRKSPAFSLAAIATLALGLGANTAVFQLIEAVFLRAAPVTHPEQLSIVQIRGGTGGFGITSGDQRLTLPLFEAIRDHQQGFASVIAWSGDGIRIGTPPDTHFAGILYASGDYFTALQLHPAAGRFFTEADDRHGCPAPGVVLSHAFWRSAYGGAASAIGSRLVVNNHPLEIIGVTPAGFTGLEVGDTFDFAIPICGRVYLNDGDQRSTRADVFWLNVMGRRKPGWTSAQSSAQLQSISAELLAAAAPSGYAAASIERYKKSVLEAVPGENGISDLRFRYKTPLYLLFGMTGLVLIIACANLANLMLARASARRRELAVRTALGASRLRLARHTVAEAVVLAGVGGAAGFLLGAGLSQAILVFFQTSQETVSLDLTPDWPMAIFTCGLAAATCLLLGLAPALLAASSDPGEMLKTSGRGLTPARNRFSFQRALIVVQVSFSLVLVAGSFLMVRTFRNLITLDTGLRTRGLMVASFDFPGPSYTAQQSKRMTQSIVNAIRTIPRVEAAAATTNIMIDGGSWTLGLAGELRGSSKFTWVSPGYFETVGTPLVAGRGFTSADSENAPKVAVVNEEFARRYFAGANPIGKIFRSAQEPGYPEAEYQIVGLCKDTRYYNMRDTPPPQSYAPIAQHPSYRPWATVFVRSAAPVNALSAEIRERVYAEHPGVGIDIISFEDHIRESLTGERLLAALSGFFGVLAVLLAAVGLYGVIAYIGVSRRSEVGIRMALGSTRGGIVRLFLRDAAGPAIAGLLIGLAGAMAMARAARSIFFGFGPYDPATYAFAFAILAAVALTAVYFPARRSSRLDPVAALHCD